MDVDHYANRSLELLVVHVMVVAVEHVRKRMMPNSVEQQTKLRRRPIQVRVAFLRTEWPIGKKKKKQLEFIHFYLRKLTSTIDA